jgi:hypothetical protein
MEEESVCIVEGGRRLTRLRTSKEEDVDKTTSKEEDVEKTTLKPSIVMRWRKEVRTSYNSG